MRLILCTTIYALLSLTPLRPTAASEPNSNTNSEPSFGDRLNTRQEAISARVNSLSESIDSFFSRDDSETETFDSRVRVGYSANYVEYEDPAYNLIFGAKLVLPKTKQRIQVILLSDEDDLYERKETGEATPNRTTKDAVQDQKIRIGLRNVFRKSKTSAVILDGGVKIRDPLEPFTRLSARRSFFFEPYELRFFERLYWFESEGWGSSVSIDLDRPINHQWLFRFSNNGVLDHETGLWEFNHFFALYQKLSDRTALGYTTGWTADDEPQMASTSVYIAVNYRYQLLGDWLYFQASPKLAWVREKDFHDVPSIFLKIEAVFGGI